MAADDPAPDHEEALSEEAPADDVLGEDALSEEVSAETDAPRSGRVKTAALAGLVLAIVAGGGIAAYTFSPPTGNLQGGEPVVVVELPPEKTAKPPVTMKGAGSPIRKSIDTEDAPPAHAAAKTADPETNDSPPATKPADVPGTKMPPVKRDADAPPGMTQARIIDPTLAGPKSTFSSRPPRKNSSKVERGLLARTAYGLVPVVGKGGRRPAEVYARPVRTPDDPQLAKARIALVIGGMGISSEGTHNAINRLPPDITLAFAPYGSSLQSLADKARRDGHEIMLQLPMEPFDYPDNDPGPKTMLTGLPPSENIKRLEWLTSRFSGFFGVTNYMGGRFTTSPGALTPVMNWVGEHGLVFLDDGSSSRSLSLKTGRKLGVGVMKAHEVIDHGQTARSIEAALQRLETRALEDGLAIGVGTGLPLTIQLVTKWSKALRERGIMLVPVSSAFQNQKS